MCETHVCTCNGGVFDKIFSLDQISSGAMGESLYFYHV